jgi:hypothetical protein
MESNSIALKGIRVPGQPELPDDDGNTGRPSVGAFVP